MSEQIYIPVVYIKAIFNTILKIGLFVKASKYKINDSTHINGCVSWPTTGYETGLQAKMSVIKRSTGTRHYW